MQNITARPLPELKAALIQPVPSPWVFSSAMFTSAVRCFGSTAQHQQGLQQPGLRVGRSMALLLMAAGTQRSLPLILEAHCLAYMFDSASLFTHSNQTSEVR